ncbi:MAG: gamma-glutamylcyclotransferase family protein [Pseudomonadota bacterium]
MARHYFGYGSLVNAGTRQPGETAFPCVLEGWRRTWTHFYQAPRDPGRSLSIREEAGHQIAGVVVELQDNALARLDERERGYERLELDGALFDLAGGLCPDSVYVYRSLSTVPENGLQTHPILRSYMDVVMQGYRDNFGDRGLEDLLASTDHWAGSVRQDRDAPMYPRAVTLRPGETALFDQALSKAQSAELARTLSHKVP